MKINKKLIYTSLFLIGFFYFNIKYSIPIKFDSISDINLDQTNIPQENLTIKDKLKSWCYWQAFVKNSANYQPYSEFKRSWNKEYIFKKSIIIEWNNIKNNPLNYVKDKWRFRLSRLDQEKLTLGNYIEGRGWVSRAELDHLHWKGYKIVNCKIVNIKDIPK